MKALVASPGAEANIDLFHLPRFQLLIRRLDFSDNLPADHFGIKLHCPVEILGARGKRFDPFDLKHGTS